MHNSVLQSDLYCQNNFFPKVIKGHVLLNRPKNPSSNDVPCCEHKRKTYLGLLLPSKHKLMRKVTKQCNSFRRKDTRRLSVQVILTTSSREIPAIANAESRPTINTPHTLNISLKLYFRVLPKTSQSISKEDMTKLIGLNLSLALTASELMSLELMVTEQMKGRRPAK